MTKKLNPPQQLVVYADPSYDKPIFEGPLRPLRDRTYMVLVNGTHLSLVGNPRTFFNNTKLYDCCLGRTKKGADEEHRCYALNKRLCRKCGHECWNSAPIRDDLQCSDCGTSFSRQGKLQFLTLYPPPPLTSAGSNGIHALAAPLRGVRRGRPPFVGVIWEKKKQVGTCCFRSPDRRKF